MADSKHTPGPWEVSESAFYVWDEKRRLVAEVSGASGGERAANARLIAAAPELLEAADYHVNACTAESREALRTAIAKARG